MTAAPSSMPSSILKLVFGPQSEIRVPQSKTATPAHGGASLTVARGPAGPPRPDAQAIMLFAPATRKPLARDGETGPDGLTPRAPASTRAAVAGRLFEGRR